MVKLARDRFPRPMISPKMYPRTKGNGTPAISGKSCGLVKYYEPFGQIFVHQ